jgi:Cu/Zn superoxide dismutase
MAGPGRRAGRAWWGAARPMSWLWMACGVALMAGCAGARAEGLRQETRTLTATLKAVGGAGEAAAGRATLREQVLLGVSPVPERAARLELEVSGLAEGPHGVAILAGGCDATGHLNPARGIHGIRHDVRGHAGDLGNVEVGPDGRGVLVVETLTAFGAAEVTGKAIAVHAGPDDGRTQPDGAAGARVLCGILRP